MTPYDRDQIAQIPGLPGHVSDQLAQIPTPSFQEVSKKAVEVGRDKYDKFIENHQITQVKDLQLARFKEFIDTEWGLPAVEVLFRGLFAGGYPPIPTPSQWDVPGVLDLAELVWQQTQTYAFIEDNWPSVKMLLGDNVLNTQWAAQIMTVLAFFNVIKILPTIIQGFNEQDGKL